MLALLESNPWLLYLLVFTSCAILPVILVLAIYNIRQGREFWTPLFKFGPKQPTETGSPKIENIFNPTVNVQIEQSKEIVKEIRRKTISDKLSVSYTPREIPEKNLFIFGARRDIESKIRSIFLCKHGHVMGGSFRPFSFYYQYAREDEEFDQDLVKEIDDFYTMTSLYMESGALPQDPFEEIQWAAAHINMKLDQYMQTKYSGIKQIPTYDT